MRFGRGGSQPCRSPRLANEFTRDISARVPRAIIGDRDVGIPSRCLLYSRPRLPLAPNRLCRFNVAFPFYGQSVLFGCFQWATGDMAPPTEAGGSPIRKPADQLFLQPEHYQA